MLIQITNRCHMGCPHCMQDSKANGKHMTEETFLDVLKLCHKTNPRLISISGGEPLEHPNWSEIACSLLCVRSALFVNILTNGFWIEDDHTRFMMAKLIKQSKGRVKVQVYSHPDYYKNHEWTVEHEKQFKSIGCTPDFDSPIFMQDLGRARKNCKAEVEKNSYVPSCINSHLIARQAHSLSHFLSMAAQAGKFCRPLIDVDGNIHMSESWLCQSVAHVSEDPAIIFKKMRESSPCGACKLYKNFVELHPKEMELLR